VLSTYEEIDYYVLPTTTIGGIKHLLHSDKGESFHPDKIRISDGHSKIGLSDHQTLIELGIGY